MHAFHMRCVRLHNNAATKCCQCLLLISLTTTKWILSLGITVSAVPLSGSKTVRSLYLPKNYITLRSFSMHTSQNKNKGKKYLFCKSMPLNFNTQSISFIRIWVRYGTPYIYNKYHFILLLKQKTFS